MTHSDRGFASVFVTEPEGLRLHMRSYGVRPPALQIAAIGTSRQFASTASIRSN
jgi:hypothetical protein